MVECRQTRGFQADQEFWLEFGHTYARIEPTVRPEQRFAFAMQVDGRLAEMGLAPWSIMGRVDAPEGSQAPQPAGP